MLSVVIPTLNAAATLPRTLAAVTGAGEVIVSDGGSADGTLALAGAARIVVGERGRGGQLARGAAAASGDWLLFLHADTVPLPGWRDALARFVADPANRARAAVFRLAFDDPSAAARRLERLVAWRGRVLALPYGDQGLLLSRELYQAIGGFQPLPIMEDVALVRRLGRRRIVVLDATVLTSARRYRGGPLRRSLRNLACLALYFLGAPPRLLVRLYG
ncbi:MAG: glycosyltransferase [Alphaproteobacteria bacterium]|nr:glycosyltransferase [Alphaproteobacteria bacterium]